jgi:mRNA-degrading endonuclease RelE of RelBE toxin-antitoxin system
VKWQIEPSNRAVRDFDRLSRDVQQRMLKRLEQLAEDPYVARLSGSLTNQGSLRKSYYRAARAGLSTYLKNRLFVLEN